MTSAGGKSAALLAAVEVYWVWVQGSIAPGSTHTPNIPTRTLLSQVTTRATQAQQQ